MYERKREKKKERKKKEREKNMKEWMKEKNDCRKSRQKNWQKYNYTVFLIEPKTLQSSHRENNAFVTYNMVTTL